MEKVAQLVPKLKRSPFRSEKKAPLKQISGDGRKRWLTLNES
jgi:hypothetical protein